MLCKFTDLDIVLAYGAPLPGTGHGQFIDLDVCPT
jgi:hypothetical protein